MCTHSIALLLQLCSFGVRLLAGWLAGWLLACFRRCASPVRNERFRGRLLRGTSLGMRSSGNDGRRNPFSEIWQCEILTNFLLFSARVRICFVLFWFFFFLCVCWSGSSSLAFHSFLCVSWSGDEPPWMWRKCSVSLLCWFIFFLAVAFCS